MPTAISISSKARRRRSVTALLGAALLAASVTLALAQSVQEIETRHAGTLADLETINREMTLSQERIGEIASEIDAMREDAAGISAALVQAAKTERKLAQDIEDISATMDGLRLQEDGLRSSLHERRDVLAQVLGALQRIGLNPPPAVLVTPEDALGSVRSSILLAAVVPELRAETEILIGDLRELSRLTASIEGERQRLQNTMTSQAEEQQRLSLLLEERQRLQARSQELLAQEQARAEQLASEAGSMQELIEALEADLDIARREAEDARLATLATPQEAPPSPEPTLQLRPATPFAALRGQVALPVSGQIERRFGQDDGAGTTLMGDMVATHSGAIVTTPTDGSVLYAGAFRSYGQLLILDAGDDYHIVLAGMDRISVMPGQQVLAGEPVGVMGEARVASAMAFGNGQSGPGLYVEFRREGRPVDPAPWWAERFSGRAGNDS
jgi:murein hydrolase activator